MRHLSSRRLFAFIADVLRCARADATWPFRRLHRSLRLCLSALRANRALERILHRVAHGFRPTDRRRGNLRVLHGEDAPDTLYVCSDINDGLRRIHADFNAIIVLLAGRNANEFSYVARTALRMLAPPDVERQDAGSDLVPSVLRMEPTNYCSARCRMCPNRYIIRRHGRRELGPAALNWEFLRTVKDTIFLQNGEFTEAQHLPAWLHALGGGRTRLHVTTNGMRLTPILLQQLVAAGLSSITFSIDATDPAVFCDIRIGCNLERVLKNLELALALPSRANEGRPVVQVNITVQARNVRSLAQSVHDLAARGVDAIHLQYARIHPENVEAGDMQPADSVFFAQDTADESIRSARAAVQGFACDLSAPLPFRRGAVPHAGRPVTDYCWQPFSDVIVWANGDVTPCIGAQSLILGNVFAEPLEKIWFGEPAQRFRSQMLSATPPDECTECLCGGQWNGRVFDQARHVY